MTIWADFGFRENPYGVGPLAPDEEGSRLLVGRDAEVETLLRKLASLDTHPTLEGDNGVGKTSLVAVAAYRGMQAGLTQPSGSLFLPLRQAVQLTPSTNVTELERQILFAVAHLLIEQRPSFRQAGFAIPDLGAAEGWLRNPAYTNVHGGFLGLTAGGGHEPNTTGGFEQSGFRSLVVRELERTFPSRANGGIVCTLDNLELLETSSAARAALEAARDTLFAIPGLRWVLCGAKGIVRSVASSPRGRPG